MNRWQSITAASLALICAGCAHTLPAGYVKVDPGHAYRFRAVNADGAAFTLRTEENPENGDLVFWGKAIKRNLVDIKGYKLADERDVALRSAADAREMTFDYKRAGKEYTYLLTLVVSGRRVHIFEAAGEKERVAADLPEIRKVIAEWPAL
ncbi:MAG: hypothetical protein JXA69_05685 [Phycisphaerae bacterium]|nr:hypothetical protein [Phycisphaerae bacterium]